MNFSTRKRGIDCTLLRRNEEISYRRIFSVLTALSVFNALSVILAKFELAHTSSKLAQSPTSVSSVVAVWIGTSLIAVLQPSGTTITAD